VVLSGRGATTRGNLMGRVLRGAGLFASALLLTGCFWPAVGAGPGRTAHNPFEDTITAETVAGLEELWSAPTEGAARYPVTSAAGVHVVGDRTVYGVARENGEQLWEHTMSWPVPGPRVGPMVNWDGALWAGWYMWGTLLDPLTGDSLGDPPAEGQIQGVRSDQYAVVGFSGWIDATVNGSTFLVGDPEANLDYPDQTMTLGEDHLFVAGPGLALSPDGLPVYSSSGLRAFATEELDFCYEHNPRDLAVACPEWELTHEIRLPPVLDSEKDVLYAAYDTTVLGVAAADGSELWSADVGVTVAVEPALADGVLFVVGGSPDGGRLVAVDADDGVVLWEADTSAGVEQQPAVAGGLVFTAATDGTVEVFAIDACAGSGGGCDPVWSVGTGSAITGAPAVDRGQLYVGTADGRLVAYGLPN
jgi:outer membrane protein assembly factor BamB